MSKFVISDPALLAAALLFTSTERAREYLHGVHIAPAQGGGVLIAATDGVGLFQAYDAEGHAAGCSGMVRVPSGKLPAAMLRPRPVRAVWIDTDARSLQLQGSTDEGEYCHAIDGHFPDVARCIPREASGDAAQFAFPQLARLGAATRLLAARFSASGHLAVRIHHNGAGPAAVTFPWRPECLAVVMPVRAIDAAEEIPALPQPAYAPPALAAE